MVVSWRFFMLVLKEKFKVTSTVIVGVRREGGWKPRRMFSGACHRLAPIEGRKEDKWKQAFPQQERR
jgi:hypothetical protein